MRAALESIEKNQASIHVEVEEERVAEALEQAYRKIVKKTVVPGFRKGRVPRPILEARLGKEVLYQEALEILLEQAYREAVIETAIEPIDHPEIDVIQMEEGKPLIFNVKVEVLPEVKLGDNYKGVTAVIPEVKIGDDEVEAHLKLLQQRHARLVDAGDKAIDDGDVAVIDLETVVNGKVEQRLSGKDQIIEVGMAKFIPGFEGHLIDMKAGERKEFTLNLPSVFQYKDLEGKEAKFKVKVVAVKRKEYPDLDDEFARDVSEFSTLEELKEHLRKKLEETGQRQARRIFKERVVAKVVDDAEVEIPEPLLKRQLNLEYSQFLQRLAMQRLNMDDYLRMVNKDKEALRQDLEDRARRIVKTRLVLGAVAKAEGIKVTPEELEQEINDMAAQYNLDAEKLRADLEARDQIGAIEEDLLMEKVSDFLADNAVALTEEPDNKPDNKEDETAQEAQAEGDDAGKEEEPGKENEKGTPA